MKQFDEYFDHEIIEQQNKRLEDVKGMRDCCMCSHCCISYNTKLFNGGQFMCFAKKIWKDKDDRLEYNCLYFTARSCLTCFYYDNKYHPCSVSDERLRNGVDMRYSYCTMYRNKLRDKTAVRRSVLGRILIDASFYGDFCAQVMETKWLINQVAQGNGYYVKARRYSSKVKRNMLALYDQYKARYEEKVARDEDDAEKVKRYMEEGYGIYGKTSEEQGH